MTVRSLNEGDAAAWWHLRSQALARDEDALVGIATFILETGVKEGHKGRIYGVYVDPLRRRRGIGRALIADLMERAKRIESLEQILLAVATCQQAARELYREFGFETHGTEPRDLKVGASYIDEDHMILNLQRNS